MVCITDRGSDHRCSRGKKEQLGKAISKQLEQLILNRESVTAVREDKKYVSIIAGEAEEYTCQVIYPIICEGDAIGQLP